MIDVRPLERAAARGLRRLPRGVLSLLAGRAHEKDGQTLDPMVQFILRVQRLRRRPELQDLDPDAARQEYAHSLGILDEAPRPMRTVEDLDADGVPARLYVPEGPAPVGLLVYLHGGGGVIGDLESCDAPVRLLAAEGGFAVLSVHYRLAPEHPWPAALEDTRAAFDWAKREAKRLGFDPGRIAIGGDSYGGSLSALLCLERRGEDGPKAQLLIYPCTDFLRQGGSRELFAQGYLLDRPLIDWFRDHTFRSQEERVAASALRAEDVSSAAPAIVVTAGFDPLRDEAMDYADRLSAAGVRVFHRCEPGLVHAFISMTGVVPAAHASVVDMARRLAHELTS